jgi:hypothetical protein
MKEVHYLQKYKFVTQFYNTKFLTSQYSRK